MAIALARESVSAARDRHSEREINVARAIDAVVAARRELPNRSGGGKDGVCLREGRSGRSAAGDVRLSEPGTLGLPRSLLNLTPSDAPSLGLIKVPIRVSGR